jgi:hypothetical protein
MWAEFWTTKWTFWAQSFDVTSGHQSSCPASESMGDENEGKRLFDKAQRVCSCHQFDVSLACYIKESDGKRQTKISVRAMQKQMDKSSLSLLTIDSHRWTPEKDLAARSSQADQRRDLNKPYTEHSGYLTPAD